MAVRVKTMTIDTLIGIHYHSGISNQKIIGRKKKEKKKKRTVLEASKHPRTTTTNNQQKISSQQHETYRTDDHAIGHPIIDQLIMQEDPSGPIHDGGNDKKIKQ